MLFRSRGAECRIQRQFRSVLSACAAHVCGKRSGGLLGLHWCQCRHKTPAVLPVMPVTFLPAGTPIGGDAVGTLQQILYFLRRSATNSTMVERQCPYCNKDFSLRNANPTRPSVVSRTASGSGGPVTAEAKTRRIYGITMRACKARGSGGKSTPITGSNTGLSIPSARSGIGSSRGSATASSGSRIL